MDRQDISDKVKGLIHSAMEGFLTPELLFNCWDLSWNRDEYLMNIYDNLEISVDHIPGYFLKKVWTLKNGVAASSTKFSK